MRIGAAGGIEPIQVWVSGGWDGLLALAVV
jgi:hypothetical protein